MATLTAEDGGSIMIKEAIDKIHKENDMVKDIEDNLFNKVTSKDIKGMK